MNRSCIAFAALLGLSLLPVNAARSQALPSESESYEVQPKPFSRLFEMIGDCAHGAVSRYEALEQTATSQQNADADYDDCKLDHTAAATTEAQPTGTQDSVAQEDYANQDDAGQNDTAQDNAAAQDEAPQEKVARPDDSQTVADDYQGEDYLADQTSTAEDAVNRAFDRAVAPPVVNTLADDADYYQQEVAAPASPVSSGNDYGYDYEYGYDKDQTVEPAAQPVATDVAAPVDAADPYDADLVETYQASETNPDDVATTDSSNLGRETLLGMANLLGRLGAALQAASSELTSLAAKDTTSINR